MPNEEMEQRFAVVERLTHLFRFERFIFLFVSVAAVITLLIMAIMLIYRQGLGKDAILLFGPSGVYAYSTSRLLSMWQDALNRIVPRGNK
jgi:hypothetical protein